MSVSQDFWPSNQTGGFDEEVVRDLLGVAENFRGEKFTIDQLIEIQKVGVQRQMNDMLWRIGTALEELKIAIREGSHDVGGSIRMLSD